MSTVEGGGGGGYSWLKRSNAASACYIPANNVIISSQDMERRKGRKEMELLWRGAASFGSSADVFTGNFASGELTSASSTEPLLRTRPA